MGVGLLSYPGALADPEAYAPIAEAVAEAGYEVVVLNLPVRLAPFERHREQLTQRTRVFVRGEGERREWVIGGHSKGGKLAAQFARDHADDIVGLLLVGTSHPREDDLSGLALDVTKGYGSEDGLASEEVDRFRSNLPETTHWTRIEGGNHAQFGWYGWQLGDGRATIRRTEQQAATIRSILDQLRRVEEALRQAFEARPQYPRPQADPAFQRSRLVQVPALPSRRSTLAVTALGD